MSEVVSECQERLAARFQRAHENAEQDAVFALDSLIIHHGRLADLDALRAGGSRTSGQADAIEGLLDAACRARFDLQPVPGPGMMRLVARETVRANKTPQDIDLQMPRPKKQVTDAVAGDPDLRT